MRGLTVVMGAALIMGWATCGVAQQVGGARVVMPPVPAAPTAIPVPQAEPAPPAAAKMIPALTPVTLEIGKELGSKISKPGDVFPIKLLQPIVVGGVELVPAGATGMGEVVDAKGAGMSGSAGRLILAARYLDVGGRHLRLRSMHLVMGGKSRTDLVNNLGVATAVALPPAALLLLFVSGNNVAVPAGSTAEAKTAEDFALANDSATSASIPSVTERKTP